MSEIEAVHRQVQLIRREVDQVLEDVERVHLRMRKQSLDEKFGYFLLRYP